MKHQMILVAQSDTIEAMMEFQQDIVYAVGNKTGNTIQLKKLEIKPVDPRD